MRSPKGADHPLGKRKVTFLKTNEWSADVTGTEWVRWFGLKHGLKQKMEHSRTVRQKKVRLPYEGWLVFNWIRKEWIVDVAWNNSDKGKGKNLVIRLEVGWTNWPDKELKWMGTMEPASGEPWKVNEDIFI